MTETATNKNPISLTLKTKKEIFIKQAPLKNIYIFCNRKSFSYLGGVGGGGGRGGGGGGCWGGGVWGG